MSKIAALLQHHKLSLLVMVILTLIMFTFTYQLIHIQSQIGVAYWDIFVYLNNALRMAGMSVGDSLFLPPVLPALTSLFFRAGYVSEMALFIVSGILYLLGTLGMYLLLKIRFNEWESLAGALSFATFTVVVAWAVTGALDVPAASLSIWSLYFTVLAVKKDSRFYYLAFPTAMLAFLTRYTSGFIIIPLLLLIYLNHPSKPDLKNMVKGIVAGLLVYLPFMWYFHRQLKDFFPFISTFTRAATGGTSSPASFDYVPDLLYYLRNIPQYISTSANPELYTAILWPSWGEANWIAYLILGLIIVGIVLYLTKIIHLLQDKRFSPKNWRLGMTILLGLLLIITYGRISFLFSELIMIIWILCLYFLLRDYKIPYLDLDLAILTWFLAFFIMHSFQSIKVDRYFITMVPPLAYGVALGIHQISNLLKAKFKGFNYSSAIISIFIVLVLILSTSTYLADMPREDQLVLAEKETTEWLVDYDPGWEDKVLASDRGPAYSWYLKSYVYTRIPGRIEAEKFQELFREVDPDYYIYQGNLELELANYNIVHQVDNIIIYEKIS